MNMRDCGPMTMLTGRTASASGRLSSRSVP